MRLDSNETAIPLSGGLKVIVDTGASFLLLPQRYVDVYYRRAPFVANDPYQGYIFPCNERLPDLTLQIECHEPTISGKLMVGAIVSQTSQSAVMGS